jgi:outer membrane protein
MIKIALPLLILPLSLPVFAAEKADHSPDLNIGLGMVVQSGEYLGEDTEVMPFPTLSYEGERLFLRGAYGGVHLYKNSSFNVSAILSTNIQKLDVDDLDSNKLAQRNLTKDQLEDRDMSVDAGLEAVWKSAYGNISLQALGDIGGASEAGVAKLNYQYFWNVNDKWTVVPNIGATWLSDDRANYYYGTLDSEEAKGVERYRPDSLVIPHVSLGTSYQVNQNWRATAIVTHKMLPNKAANGPLMDNDSRTSLFVGASRKF